MKKSLSICTVFVIIVFFALASWAAEFDGQADYELDSLGYYYALTGGRFPNGQIYTGNNASGGTLRFLADDPGWGHTIDQWQKDDWFDENSGLALTMKYEGSIAYDNNGIEEGDPDGFYHEDTNSNLAGLYRGYCMSNNWDWVYSGYFNLNSPTLIDTIIGYFDPNSGFDPNNPNIAYRMNIWSSTPDGTGMIPAVNSFTGDMFSTDSTSGAFLWSDTGVDRYYSGWPAPYTDDIWRLTFTLNEPITLPPGEYFFSHDAVVIPIVATPNPIAVNVPGTLNAVVTNENDIASAWYTLDGGDEKPMAPTDSAFDYTNEQVYAVFSVSTPGIYDLCAYAKDEGGMAGPEVCTLLVVYDPDGGFVTGGGWIDSPSGAYKMHYDDIVLNEWQTGNFENIWDITKGDLTLSYTIDLSAQATGGWTPVEAGLREVGQPNLDPHYLGGWMMSIWQYPTTNPTSADIDDHFLLVDHGWLSDELDYDVDENGDIVSAFGSYSNYAFWFDRDGVDSDQATYWNYKDGITYNTNGIYDVVITYHAVNANTGTMFATINEESQGFYASYSSTDPPDRQPVGRSFSGDMTQMQVFYGRGSGGGIVTLSNFTVAPPIIGRANFGFVSKYKKGATTPDGNTEFVFKAADLNFHSSSYQWLVVTGSDYAKFKGTGTINGEGEYKFQLWAGDGDPDTFRIKIWEEDEYANETVIYDNGMDQYITGGSIVVHTKKK